MEWKPWTPEKFSVKQITAQLKRLLREKYSNISVSGEISALKVAASGHLYFNLKEEDTVLSCAMYKQNARLLKTALRDGMQVQARGSIDIYEPRGAYQFLVEHVELQGAGALQQAFEALKRRLQEEGLFEAARKRPLPKYPRRIGIVTSPTGAVIQDMLHVFARRSPGLEIRIYPALVQGAGSAEQLCDGLRYFTESGWPDVIVVARGGGSIEDLWSFNEESVARAIAASAMPVVSAVGHETDFTIADFVADLRAPTPSAAAEIIAPDVTALIERIEGLERSMARSVRHSIATRREMFFRQGVERARTLLVRRLNRLSQTIDEKDARMNGLLKNRLWNLQLRYQKWTFDLMLKDQRIRFMMLRERLWSMQAKLDRRVTAILSEKALRQKSLEGQLSNLNPTRILDRGFALVFDADRKVIRDAKAVSDGQALQVRVASGEFGVVVGTGKTPARRKTKAPA